MELLKDREQKLLRQLEKLREEKKILETEITNFFRQEEILINHRNTEMQVYDGMIRHSEKKIKTKEILFSKLSKVYTISSGNEFRKLEQIKKKVSQQIVVILLEFQNRIKDYTPQLEDTFNKKITPLVVNFLKLNREEKDKIVSTLYEKTSLLISQKKQVENSN